MQKIQDADTGQAVCKPKSVKCVYKTIFSICVVYKGKRPGKTIQFLFKTDRFGNKTVKIEVENDHLGRKFDEKSGQKQGRISSKKRWQKWLGVDRFLKKSDNKIRKRLSYAEMGCQLFQKHCQIHQEYVNLFSITSDNNIRKRAKKCQPKSGKDTLTVNREP